MKKSNKKPTDWRQRLRESNKKQIGWRDWHVIVSMILFLILMLCAGYTGIKILKFISFIPAVYALIRTVALLIDE